MATNIWSFERITAIIDSITIKDYAADTGIEFNDNSERSSQVKSLTKGSVTYNKLNDHTGYVKFSLLENSETHKALYEHYIDTYGKNDMAKERTFNITIVNNNTNALSSRLEDCWYKTMPKPALGKEIQNIDIEIWYAFNDQYEDVTA